MSRTELPDGLEALKNELPLAEIMRLIERTARWVDPATFKLLPVWYPEFARRTPYYKGRWSAPQMNKTRATGVSAHKQEGNTYANKALTEALGLSSRKRQSWSCCHLWGVDDPKYQKTNAVVQDRRFFSCLANMVLLPVPLKAFTDAMPEVKCMLRICALNLYGWHCDDESVADAVQMVHSWNDWASYPASWPREPGNPISMPGIVRLNDLIQRRAEARIACIKSDLAEAGEFYPREAVQASLTYWAEKVPSSPLFSPLQSPPRQLPHGTAGDEFLST